MKKHTKNVLKILFGFILLINIHIISYSYSELDNIGYQKYNDFPYNYNLIVYEPQVKELEVEKDTNKNIVPSNKEYAVLDTFTGSMTAYGPDCKGCSGVTAWGYDIRNTIYYNDSTFGEIRIVAADDRLFSFGTVFRVSGLNVYDKPFLAIMLDTGNKKYINNYRMDLAFSTENDPLVDQIGDCKNITYEVLRYGW